MPPVAPPLALDLDAEIGPGPMVPATRTSAWRWPAVRLVVAALALALFVRIVARGWDGLAAAGATLIGQRPGWLVLIAALVTVWIVALAEVQRRSARVVGAAVGRRDALRISRGAFTLSRVVPGGGAAGGVFAIREYVRLGHRPGVAAAIAVVSWAVCTLVLATVVVTVMAVVAVAGAAPIAILVPAAAVVGGLAAVAGLVLVAVRDDGVRHRVLAWLDDDRAATTMSAATAAGTVTVRTIALRLRTRASAALRDLAEHTRGGASPRAAGAWAAVAAVTELALLWTVFAAVGTPLPPAVLAIGFVSAHLLNTVPEATPGWIGVHEAAMVATYTALGVPADAAVIAVLAHRLATFWLPVTVGIVPALRSLSAGRRARRALPPMPPAPASRPARTASAVRETREVVA